MIDKTAFVAGMTALAAAFGREVEGPTQAMYYGVLSSRMSTEEFERAIGLTVASETYWPSPALILSKVHADDTTRGLMAFEHVNRVLGSTGGYRFLTTERYDAEFDGPTRAAITAVGGFSAIASTTEERWEGLKKRFAAAYVDSKQPKLPPPPPDPRVKRLVGSTVLSLQPGMDRRLGRDA